MSEGIVPGLEKLSQDSDADVRFFAEKGLVTAQAVASGEAPEVTMSDA